MYFKPIKGFRGFFKEILLQYFANIDNRVTK